MLKTISSITNALGALNYKGTWNASTNTPTLTSSVGAKGDYYVVSVAGTTNLNGEALWGVGDWAVFNGSVWQRVEGGDTINATTVSASTSVSTPVIQALSSAGGTLKNNGGTNQMQWGSGGGNNLSLEVATNINPANAAVNISPTGTGTVTINPETASTINNMSIGATTALTGRFSGVTVTPNNINVAGLFSGFGTTGVNGYVTTTQQFTADDTLSRHHKANAGGGTANTTQCTQTTTGITTAKVIAGLEDASFIIVRGSDGAGNEFMDNLISTNSGTPTVLHSVTISGSPAARTYSIASFNLRLAMASGTYSTNCVWFQMTAR